VLAGLQGDVHDLGKNILKIILTAKGYQVVDCGKDCPLEEIISAAVHHDADIIGLSGLISSVVPQVQEAREKLVSRGLAHIHVIAGGSALMQLAAKTLNVEFVGKTAFDGARYIAETCCAGSD
jgi:methylmalonyl-CoA mutase cobalamin-binding domain/chain